MSGEQLARLVAHLRFENFAKNESVNYEVGKQLSFMRQDGRFIRKGCIHISYWDPELMKIHLNRQIFMYRKNWRLEKSFQSGVESTLRSMD